MKPKQPTTWTEIEKEVETIIGGIGSPYGEGATYNRGAGYTHLDEADAGELKKDILSFLKSKITEVALQLIGEDDKPIVFPEIKFEGKKVMDKKETYTISRAVRNKLRERQRKLLTNLGYGEEGK